MNWMRYNKATAKIRNYGLGLFFAISVAGCATPLQTPDLGQLYNRAAQYHGVERRPVIVIPGILGSKLVDPTDGTVVWGAFGAGAVNPRTPDGARLAALPMREGFPLSECKDDVVVNGALDRLKLNLDGLPIQLSAYANILASLGAGGYRDQQLADLGVIDYGDDHFTCFQFAYDWRRSNVENAKRLQEFILEKRAYVQTKLEERYDIKNHDVKFDIVAHSMGGLITRYFLRYGGVDLADEGSLPEITWSGANYVHQAILVATPNAGSARSIDQLANGFGVPPIIFFPGSILGTFPSIYELLPRPRHGALVKRDSGDKINVYDPGVWEAYEWGLANPEEDKTLQWLMPNEESAEQRRAVALDHLRKSLRRAERFHEALDKPATPPKGISIHLVAGDAENTIAVYEVNEETGELRVARTGHGDGTVLRASALLDERMGSEWMPQLISPIAWDHVTFLFRNHLGLSKDPVFTDNVLYLLLEQP